MNAQTHTVPEPASSTAPTYSFTFGRFDQRTKWTDRQTLTFSELADLLTCHRIGPKEGTCIVPAIFCGDRRTKEQAERIDVAFLDSDAGSTLQEIKAAISERGLAAVISSTHSHLMTRTRATRADWAKFRAKAGAGDDIAAAFLISEKGYLSRVAEGARLVQEAGRYAIFEHQPCPRFRIAIPLLHPWLRECYDNQGQADAAWKEGIGALAATLQLDHDQSCTDTSHLFYLPRRPPDGPPAETAILEGEPCDIFALPSASAGDLLGTQAKRNGPFGVRTRRGLDRVEFADPDTGEVFDLTTWAREHGHEFQIVEALRARRPGVFADKVADGTKHHIRCVNESEHTQAGADLATFVVNAQESSSKGFVCHCRHGHCDGRDRLFFVCRMLEAG